MRTGGLDALADQLRALPAQLLSELDSGGEEFVLVLARRTSKGDLELVGKVPRIDSLLERSAVALVRRNS